MEMNKVAEVPARKILKPLHPEVLEIVDGARSLDQGEVLEVSGLGDKVTNRSLTVKKKLGDEFSVVTRKNKLYVKKL